MNNHHKLKFMNYNQRSNDEPDDKYGTHCQPALVLNIGEKGVYKKREFTYEKILLMIILFGNVLKSHKKNLL